MNNEIEIKEISPLEYEMSEKARMRKEFSFPIKSYSQRLQADCNERLLNIKRRYNCSDAEAIVILTTE